ncbi:MAG: aconitate hydratase [Tissierellales bacterium]|nr:aconitate hydratase [Tissierellales bacterium]
MKKNIVQKILEKHLVSGELILGKEIEINVDQTLTQDSTGTMVYLQLEAMNVEKVKTNISVAYIDHNTLQTGFENADDHEFIKSAADKYGLIFSKAGNGICHQLHLENFGKPGKTLLGSDSHTPTNGGLGMISIGAGGLDVAVAMATGKYMFKMPKVVNIVLKGNLQPWVSSKDVILYLLGKLSVKGAVGKILEYSGGGIKSLSVTDRGTITNMGAELGATTSIFPSDERTYEFLKSQNRSEDWVELKADEGAKYDQVIELNLNKIEPMIAKPHSPDNVTSIDSVKGLKIDQVAIGSCTNSSYSDLMKVAKILKGKKVHQDVSLSLSPGSSKILNMIAKNGALADIIASGARVLECSCGPCIGMGQAPKTNGISLRTFNRNFYGRSGTKSAGVYLVSPETAAASALKGVIEDPRNLGKPISIIEPEIIIENKSLFIYPSNTKKYSEVTKGPNIKSFPTKNKIDNNVEGKVLIKVGDDITTDHIMPSSSELLPYRSNIPYLSKYVFSTIEENFWEKCQDGGGIIIAGNNYGQGSSREHAALVPLYLGIKVVIAKSFARIHKANLINAGILPLEFNNVEDYENIGVEDELLILNLDKGLRGNYLVNILNKTKNKEIKVKFNSSERDAEIIKIGGYLNWINKKLEDI